MIGLQIKTQFAALFSYNLRAKNRLMEFCAQLTKRANVSRLCGERQNLASRACVRRTFFCCKPQTAADIRTLLRLPLQEAGRDSRARAPQTISIKPPLTFALMLRATGDSRPTRRKLIRRLAVMQVGVPRVALAKRFRLRGE